MENVNNTGINIKRFYKVPRGFGLPFAGRWLKAIGHRLDCVEFVAAGGTVASLDNESAELLARNADSTRITSPRGFH